MDFSKTYAPVVKFTSIRALLAIVTKLHLYLHQMDVVTAFLYGKLDEEVYMEQPERYVNGNPEKTVCLLVRSLFGLKQTPRQWNKEIDIFFVAILV